MATREEMSRYFWSASTNCLPVLLQVNRTKPKFAKWRLARLAVLQPRSQGIPWERGWPFCGSY